MKIYIIIAAISAILGISGTWYLKNLQYDAKVTKIEKSYDDKIKEINDKNDQLSKAQEKQIEDLNNKLTTLTDKLAEEGLGDYENIINNGNNIIDELVNSRMRVINTSKRNNNTRAVQACDNSSNANTYKTRSETRGISKTNERILTDEDIKYLVNFSTDAEITNSALKQCIQLYDTVRTEVNNGQTVSEVK